MKRLAEVIEKVRGAPRQDLPEIFKTECVEHGGCFIPDTARTGQPWPADAMASVHLLEVTGFGPSDEAACADWIKAAERTLEGAV